MKGNGVVLAVRPNQVLRRGVICRRLQKLEPLDLTRTGNHQFDRANLTRNDMGHAGSQVQSIIVIYNFLGEDGTTRPFHLDFGA